jgi:hypothetical protein
MADGVPRCFYVRTVRARKSGDYWSLNLFGDNPDCLSVPGTGDRETCLDHIDAQTCELLGYLKLLRSVESDPWRLLTVAESCVEDYYSV